MTNKFSPAEAKATIDEWVSRWVADSQGDPVELLAILRFLEALHRGICDTQFQAALPCHRHELYPLLRTIETEGGWPYIPRMQLKTILAALNESQGNEPQFPEDNSMDLG